MGGSFSNVPVFHIKTNINITALEVVWRSKFVKQRYIDHLKHILKSTTSFPLTYPVYVDAAGPIMPENQLLYSAASNLAYLNVYKELANAEHDDDIQAVAVVGRDCLVPYLYGSIIMGEGSEKTQPLIVFYSTIIFI